MKLIKSLLEASLTNLSNHQKGLLASIYSSATPTQAYETSVGAGNSVEAKNILLKLGLVSEFGNELELTDAGKQALYDNNIIDDTGELTDEGNEQLENYEMNKQEYISLENFDMLKSFCQ